MNPLAKHSLSCSTNRFILGLALLFTFLFNFPFLSGVINETTKLGSYSAAFLASVPVLLFCILTLFFSLFSVPYVLKSTALLLTLISAFVYYGTEFYGIIFDYGMIQNTFETDQAEALSYLNWHAVWVLAVILIPSLYIIGKTTIRFRPLKQELWQRGKLLLAVLAVMAVIVKAFYADYAATGRNHRYLKKELIPFQYVSSSYKYLRDTYLKDPVEFKVLDNAPSLKASAKPSITVVVVGETARARNFSYSGYEKETNRFTKDYNINYFQQVTSCGTATAVSVPCMFSRLNREDFSRADADNQQNVLDLASLAGVDVLWIDNNSGCKNVCNRVTTVKIDPSQDSPLCDGKYCFDEILVEELNKKLATVRAKSTLVVLHMIGSHGPTYFRRYPEKARAFTPDCQRSDIQNCSEEELVNTYDNTILYSDYVNAEIVKTLQQYQDDYQVSMLYVSDHGESLGENGAYLHGFPYAFAPAEQTHIPMYFWAGSEQPEFSHCLEGQMNAQLSQDNVFHSLLGVVGVQSSTLDESLNIFSQCRS